MNIRKTVVAGQFYDGSREGCIEELKQCLAEGSIDREAFRELGGEIVCGIVPHAGWVFSGATAGKVFLAIKEVNDSVDTFVLFGAVHSCFVREPAVYDEGAWESPLGLAEIDEELAGAIADTSLGRADKKAHLGEHSIEVQIPFIQYLFEGAKIVPVMVPPIESAVRFGAAVGEVIKNTADKKIVCIASTDLTHYGPRYGFCPQGAGPEGIRWAKEVNDAEFIELTLSMKAEELLVSAEANMSACGPGAAAAVVATARQLGKNKGVLLEHIHSNDVMLKRYGQVSSESVGYAAIVF